MDYYKEKRQAINLIDEMLAEGKDVDTIALKVGIMFGFSKKLVLERAELIQKFLEGNENKKPKK